MAGGRPLKFSSPEIIITSKAIKDLIPAEYNPRQINKDAFEQLKRSLESFECVEPAVININPDRLNVIIGGHQRIKAAKSLGWKEFPCIEIDLPLEREKELNIRLNKNTGEFDMDMLANHFDVSDLVDWGFDESEFGIVDVENIPEGDEDDAPEVQTEAITVLGDLYEIGSHRLLCGDSTSIDAVDKLMAGNKADMVFTDPPYGMNAVTKSGVLSKNYKQDILGDDNPDVAKNSFKLIYNLFVDAQHFWWGANYYSSILPDSECWIVWDKNNGQSDQTDCELAWTNMRSTVRQYTQASEKTNRVHPTQKPVSLFSWILERFEIKGNIILDIFGGSGSTMIGSEKAKRISLLMELDPRYCDVIVKRMHKAYPNLEIKLNGEIINYDSYR